jgi:ABC-type dipeptide/oligopeptide/nickel transport system permease component
VTVVGLQVGFLLGGTVVIENLFALPGIGSLLIQAIDARDLITVQAITLVIASAFVLVNSLVDVLYQVIDPRIRIARSHV